MTLEELDKYRDILQELFDLESGLTDWELDFMKSIDRQLSERSPRLSDAQRDTLTNLWTKHFG